MPFIYMHILYIEMAFRAYTGGCWSLKRLRINCLLCGDLSEEWQAAPPEASLVAS